jgi:hypothetical protein
VHRVAGSARSARLHCDHSVSAGMAGGRKERIAS